MAFQVVQPFSFTSQLPYIVLETCSIKNAELTHFRMSSFRLFLIDKKSFNFLFISFFIYVKHMFPVLKMLSSVVSIFFSSLLIVERRKRNFFSILLFYSFHNLSILQNFTCRNFFLTIEKHLLLKSFNG